MDNGFAEGYAVGQGNANNNGWGNGAWGAEWLWIIVLFALFGNNGWGFGGNGGGNIGYELGKVATSNDVAVQGGEKLAAYYYAIVDDDEE
jgi:hypothetical protein